MKRRLVVAIAVACVAVVVAATPALATAIASLQVTQTKGYYGQETALQPSVDTTIVPGATFELQASTNASDWAMFGELQGVEETGVVDPFYNVFDNSITYPTYVRVAYRSKGVTIGAEPTAVTAPTRLYALEYLSTRVRLTGAKTAVHGKSYSANLQVMPVSGEGHVRVVVYKRVGAHWRWQRAFTVDTDEVDSASFKFKTGSRGTYRIRAQFAGNQFSVPSVPVNKAFTVR